MSSAIKETTQPSLPEASENFTKFSFVATKAVFANKRGRRVFTTLRPFLVGRERTLFNFKKCP